MKDYITPKQRTHFSMWQKIKYELKRIFRGEQC